MSKSKKVSYYIMKNKLIIWGISFAVSLFFIFIIKNFLIDIYLFRGNAMLPNVHNGDRLIISRVSKIKVGDVVIYKITDTLRVGRVIGQEKDTIKTVSGSIVSSNKNGNKTNFISVYYQRNYNFSNIKENKSQQFFLVQKNKIAAFQKNKSLFYAFPNAEVTKKALPLVLKSNTFFILNDNRNCKSDSRKFNEIALDQIEGVAIIKFFSEEAVWRTKF